MAKPKTRKAPLLRCTIYHGFDALLNKGHRGTQESVNRKVGVVRAWTLFPKICRDWFNLNQSQLVGLPLLGGFFPIG